MVKFDMSQLQHTQQHVAKVTGMTQSNVSKIIAKAKERGWHPAPDTPVHLETVRSRLLRRRSGSDGSNGETLYELVSSYPKYIRLN